MKVSKRGKGKKPKNDDFEMEKNLKAWQSLHQETEMMSNSEDDYDDHEKMLLDKARKSSAGVPNNFKKKQAIMDLPSDDDDDMDSDIEGKDDDGIHLPDQRAWGQNRRNFHNTDYIDQDYGGFDGEDAEAADLEEHEAREIQQRLTAELEDADFSLDIFSKAPTTEKSDSKFTEEHIKTDLTSITKREKLAILQKEAPELVGIINEFRDTMKEVLTHWQPAMELVHKGCVGNEQLAQYINTKFHLSNNYAMNMGFYLLLKSRKRPIAAHPVIKRILSYRQLLQQLEPLKEIVDDQLKELLATGKLGSLKTANTQSDKKLKKRGKLLSILKNGNQKSTSAEDITEEIPSKKSVSLEVKKNKKETTGSSQNSRMPWQDSHDLGEMDKFDNDSDKIENEDEGSDATNDENIEENNEGLKRGITWQMAKNKGLTPHRKKEQRNPRVKHRNKFKKAKIRRKGQVREPRKELQRYGGEISGIKASVSKSIKIK